MGVVGKELKGFWFRVMKQLGNKFGRPLTAECREGRLMGGRVFWSGWDAGRLLEFGNWVGTSGFGGSMARSAKYSYSAPHDRGTHGVRSAGAQRTGTVAMVESRNSRCAAYRYAANLVGGLGTAQGADDPAERWAKVPLIAGIWYQSTGSCRTRQDAHWRAIKWPQWSPGRESRFSTA